MEGRSVITRPPMRYHGGKWKLAPWIIAHLPAHRVYCESFGGAASVLLRKPRAYAEVYNDLNGDVVNLMRCLREPGLRRELAAAVQWTPYSRAEFDATYEPTDDPIERARRTLLQANAGHSTTHQSTRRTGFRSDTSRAGTIPAHDWRSLPPVLLAIGERLQGVVIEDDDALTVMQRYDTADTLHYLDPPYLAETRNARQAGMAYAVDMATPAQHRALIAVARELRGHVVISGYPSALYAELLGDWTMVLKSTHAESASDRIEALWIKPGGTQQGRLF